MNTETINIKIDPETKKEAQRLAKTLGFNLSTLVKGYLRQFIKTKTVHFSASEEKPTPYLLDMLRDSDADIKAGRYRQFSSPDEELRYLDSLIDDAKK